MGLWAPLRVNGSLVEMMVCVCLCVCVCVCALLNPGLSHHRQILYQLSHQEALESDNPWFIQLSKKERKADTSVFFFNYKSESMNLPTRERTTMKKLIYSLDRKRNQGILSVGKSELMVAVIINC